MPMYRKSLLILLVILLTLAGYTYYDYNSRRDEVPLSSQAGGIKDQELTGDTAVYVTGAVVQPGLVYVSFQAHIADAVNLCGGLLPTADVEAVNMAQGVKEGMHIKIPEKNQQSPGVATGTNSGSEKKNSSSGEGNSSGTAASGDIVNINQADEVTITKLPGVGPAMAKRIIEYREANGAFQTPEDLQKVKGIGKAKFAKMQGKIAI